MRRRKENKLCLLGMGYRRRLVRLLGTINLPDQHEGNEDPKGDRQFFHQRTHVNRLSEKRARVTPKGAAHGGKASREETVSCSTLASSGASGRLIVCLFQHEFPF
jgi:hypothetical protein